MNWAQWVLLAGGICCLFTIALLLYAVLWLLNYVHELELELQEQDRAARESAKAKELLRQERDPLRQWPGRMS